MPSLNFWPKNICPFGKTNKTKKRCKFPPPKKILIYLSRSSKKSPTNLVVVLCSEGTRPPFGMNLSPPLNLLQLMFHLLSLAMQVDREKFK